MTTHVADVEDHSGLRITSVGDPTAAQDAATFSVMGGPMAGALPYTLPNALIKNLFQSNAASGDTTLYTVPSNKRAVVLAIFAYNTTGSSINLNHKLRISGTNYVIGSAVAVSAGASQQIANFPIVLEAAEGYVVNTSAIGLNVWARVIEFDNTAPLFSKHLVSVASGDNTLYTVGGGKNAWILSNTLQPASAIGVVYVTNSSGGARTIKFFYVPSGGSSGTTNQGSASTSVSNGATQSINSPPALSAGDFVVYNTDANTATQIVWINVLEV